LIVISGTDWQRKITTLAALVEEINSSSARTYHSIEAR